MSGCTVHMVDAELDHGPIVLQRTVPVHDDDNPVSLSARILVEEHKAYPEALRRGSCLTVGASRVGGWSSIDGGLKRGLGFRPAGP